MERSFPLSEQNRRRYDHLRATVLPKVLAQLPERDAELFVARLERHLQSMVEGLAEVYGERPDFEDLLDRLVELAARHYVERPPDLKRLDLARMAWPDWIQHESQVGYIAYADRFAGTLRDLSARVDYLKELGVTYLHLMPLLEPRAGENDGGYAVADFRSVDPRLGTMDELEELARALKHEGISLCCDLVLNHVADDHPWARAALRGDPAYRDYFLVFDGRELPDAYEQSLPEVFPETDPGSFTQVEGLGWVWTSFHGYQWDLNWANPEVFLELAEVIFFLANRGVDVFRLDAIAFLWKRMGTACQNQPEVHALTRALRAVTRTAAPGVLFKAEAIVGPDDLIHYLGTGRHHGMVSDLAYHNTLMVQYWSSLAARDGRVITRALRRMPPIPGNTAWVTYIRCHDDIGWAVCDEDAESVGWNGAAHRAFLADFYSGAFEGSHARGADFQRDEETGDRRTSGTTASLNGLELAVARGDADLLSFAIERILLGHALILGWGALPLIYMGDELGLTNDYGDAEDTGPVADTRWMHRPVMPWDRASRRHDEATVEGRIFSGIQRLVAARKRTPQLHARWPMEVVESGAAEVLSQVRRHPMGNLLALYNFADRPATVRVEIWIDAQIRGPIDRITNEPLATGTEQLVLPPYGRVWLSGSEP